MQKRIVVVGATSTIAEHCMRLWSAQTDCEFILLGRNKSTLEAIKNDLLVRQPKNTIELVVMDFLDSKAIQQTVQLICQRTIDIVLIAQGALLDQQECQANLDQLQANIAINALSPVLFAEAFYNGMQHQSAGTIAVFSSVAGERGRKSNYIYGAAKGLVTRYVEGMQHRNALSGAALHICLIKPGPTESAMTLHLKQQGAKLAPTPKVAEDIVKGIAQQKRVIYTPGIWLVIMWVIRNLPFFIFRRMDV